MCIMCIPNGYSCSTVALIHFSFPPHKLGTQTLQQLILQPVCETHPSSKSIGERIDSKVSVGSLRCKAICGALSSTGNLKRIIMRINRSV